MHALTRVKCDIKCYFSVFTLIQCFAGVHVLAYVKYFLSYLIYTVVNDNFNWTKYLLEGEEKYIIHYYDTHEEVYADA